MSLSTTFTRVQRSVLSLNSLEAQHGGVDSRVQQLARQLLHLDGDSCERLHASPGDHLEHVQALIQQDGVFSSNESLDDINTSDLRYLLTHFYFGSIFLKLNATNVSDSAAFGQLRMEHLRRARTHLSVFIARAQRLGLVQQADLDALEQARKGMTPHAKRQYKIDRFQREKETRAQLQYMLDKRAKAKSGVRRIKAGARSDDNNDDDNNNEVDHASEVELEDGGFDDEADWRRFELLQIESALLEACALLESAAGELEMLEAIDKRRSEVGERRMQADMEREREEARAAEPMRKNVTIMPGQLAALERRQQLAKQVTQQGWTPATYTPEEAAMLDMQEGNFLSGGANDAEADESEDEDADIDNPDKLRKAREWDDFKDDNPKGQGNSSRRG